MSKQKNVKIVVNDKMQKGYVYFLTEPIGKNFDPDFTPDLAPKQMLKLGVFGGKYMTDCGKEFPDDWYKDAKMDSRKHDPKKNYFGINASQPLSIWRSNWGGYIRTTRVAGFNGIVAIIWAVATKMMSVK